MIIALLIVIFLGYNYIKTKGINLGGNVGGNSVSGSAGSVSLSNSPFSDIYPSTN